MSITFNTVVGPYIEVRNPRISRKEDYITCPKNGCINHNQTLSSKYCPDCGALAVIKQRNSLESRIEVDPCGLFPKDELRMAPFSDNYESDFVYFFREDDGLTAILGEEEVYPISSRDPNNKISEFKIRCAEEIKILEKKFGKENVQVYWGVLNFVT